MTLALALLWPGAALLMSGCASPAVVDAPPVPEPPCITRDVAATNLSDVYAEAPTAAGFVRGGIIELFESEGGATWTLIVTTPDGCVNLVGAGEHWMRLPSKTGVSL